MKIIDTDINFNHLKKQIRKIANTSVETGYLSNNKRTDGQVTNAELAVIHEFGTKNIPARPFIRPAFDNNEKEYRQKIVNGIMKSFVKKTFSTSSFYKVMEAVGIQMKADIQEGIRSLPRNLKQSTINAKKSNKALIDTGQLLNAVSSNVKKY